MSQSCFVLSVPRLMPFCLSIKSGHMPCVCFVLCQVSSSFATELFVLFLQNLAALEAGGGTLSKSGGKSGPTCQKGQQAKERTQLKVVCRGGSNAGPRQLHRLAYGRSPFAITDKCDLQAKFLQKGKRKPRQEGKHNTATFIEISSHLLKSPLLLSNISQVQKTTRCFCSYQ